MDKEILQKCYDLYVKKLPIHNKMFDYYIGNTDAMKDYLMITQRSNNKANCNFLKRFIKEEVSYSVGNEITYISKSGNEEIIDEVAYSFSHWSSNHDSNLMKTMLIHSIAYELYYIDSESQYCSKVISPRNGFALVDAFGVVKLFMHIFKKEFDESIYIDVYTDSEIISYTEDLTEISKASHIFGVVPIGIARLSPEMENDVLYKDLKGLQDSYEVNLSDIVNEISDFRNAYLGFTGVDVDDMDLEKMKELGILVIPTADGKVQWIVKNINDNFIQNTLNTVEDKMYQLSCHINNNEAMQSNTSSLAIRARLISLEQKCKLNEGALKDCIKTRLKMLFIFLKWLKAKEYDYKDIKAKTTPAIPSDDTANANIVSQIGDVLSKETARGLFSFIDNPKEESIRVKKEQKEEYGGIEPIEKAVI